MRSLRIFLFCFCIVIDLSVSQEPADTPAPDPGTGDAQPDTAITSAQMAGSVSNAIEEDAAYHCRREGYRCQNGGTCTGGSCLCPPEYTSYDCGVALVDTQNCDPDLCLNGGMCYQTDRCYCPVTHYGPTCESETDTWECLGTEMKIAMMVPDKFSGSIYGTASMTDCKFTEEPSNVPGFRMLTSSLTFDKNDSCAAKEYLNFPRAGDITYVSEVVVGFHSFIQTKTDRIITFNCTHPASNVSLEADIYSSLNEKGNLTKSEEKKTYSPVRFHFLDVNENVLERALYVGEEFSNMVYLMSTDVYTDLLLERCVANNGVSNTTREIVLLDNGCPTPDGNLVLQEPPGQTKMDYTPPGFTATIPAAALKMLGFRFYDSKQVFIQCVVTICKEKDKAACEIPDCTGVNVRRKRSTDDITNSTDEQTVSGLFTIKEKPIVLPTKETVVKEKDCFRSTEIILVIICMSALVLIMLIACVILATLIARSRGKVRKLVEDRDSQGLHIPRAKLY